jgi:hypothetical protein
MSGNFAKMTTSMPFRDLLHAVETWDRWLYFPSKVRRVEDFFLGPKNPTASARCEPANLGTKGQHATSRPPKPYCADLWKPYKWKCRSCSIIYIHGIPLSSIRMVNLLYANWHWSPVTSRFIRQITKLTKICSTNHKYVN